jgi:hypothetical protein
VLCLQLDDAAASIRRAADQWLQCALEQQMAQDASAAAAASSTQAAFLEAVKEQAQWQQVAGVHVEVVERLQQHVQGWAQLAQVLPHLASLVHEVPAGQPLEQVLLAAQQAAAASLWAKCACASQAAATGASGKAAKVGPSPAAAVACTKWCGLLCLLQRLGQQRQATRCSCPEH